MQVALRGAYARLAQLVEHLTLNQGVQGSNPWSRIEVLGLRKAADSGLYFFYLKGFIPAFREQFLRDPFPVITEQLLRFPPLLPAPAF